MGPPWLGAQPKGATPYTPVVGDVAETCAKRRSLLRYPSPIPHHPSEARVWGIGLAETRAKRGFSASTIIILLKCVQLHFL